MQHLEDVIYAVRDERRRQQQKWGEQDWSMPYYLAILAEEFGEVAKEVVEMTAARIRKDYKAVAERRELLIIELVQCAAVAVAMVEALMRQKDAPYLEAKAAELEATR